MVDRALIASKLADLSDRIARVRQHRTSTPAELAAHRDASDLVAFNLMLAVQICADIASHLIADEGWPAAKTLGEAFTRLQDHQVVSPALRWPWTSCEGTPACASGPRCCESSDDSPRCWS